MQLKYGSHILFLRGGYFLQNKLRPLSGSGLQLQYQEGAYTEQPRLDSVVLQQVILLNDPEQKPVGSLVVSTSQEKLIEERKQLLTKSVYLLLGSLLGCLLIGWIISVSLSKPLRTLTSAAQEMTGGNFDVRVT